MRVVNLYPYPDHGSGVVKTVAKFSLQDATMKINGFRLRQRPNGTYSVDAPSAHGERIVHLAPDVVRRINAEAVSTLRGLDANAQR